MLDGPAHHAHQYADRGWPVIPILPGQKRPAIPEWVQKATTDHDLIDQWWTTNPTHGVGIVTGARAGIFVLDIDPDHGGDDTLATLELEHGPLPDTVEAITGSGGRHLIYRWPGWNPGTGAHRLGPGLDIRAEGGQIVAAPSIHPNGRRYMWESSYDPLEGCAVSDAPDWLLTLLKVEQEPPHARATTIAYDGDPRPGDIFANTITWPELLQTDGAQHIRTAKDGEEYWCRPGKRPAEGASATLYYGGTDVLKVFTSNWPGLREGETYNRFAYLTFTKYGGDFTASTRALADAQRADMIAEWVTSLHTTPAAEISAETTTGPEPVPVGHDDPDIHQLLAGTDPPYDWIIPGLLERGDRTILTGLEGRGKSTLLRQIAITTAAGLHPFTHTPLTDVPAPRTLYIDLENSYRQIRRKTRPLYNHVQNDIPNNQLIWHLRPHGYDLTAPDDRAHLAQLCAHHQPDIVIIGPIYKLHLGDPIEEAPAKAVATYLDLLRTHHGFALLIEAHTPYAGTSKGTRPERPYGASLWSRWPEFGIFLSETGQITHWRGQRDEREWPTQLRRHDDNIWPWEIETNSRQITFARMLDTVRELGYAPSQTDLAKMLGLSQKTVSRAIEANRPEWDQVVENL